MLFSIYLKSVLHLKFNKEVNMFFHWEIFCSAIQNSLNKGQILRPLYNKGVFEGKKVVTVSADFTFQPLKVFILS